MTSTADPRTDIDLDAAPVSRNRQHARASRSDADRRVGLLGSLVLAAGVILSLSGAGTWAFVQSSLAGENITVAEDAARFAGEPVDGPLTAYYEA
ncbi:MAG: aromatic ring-opening dioxygenase LigA, partial [Frankiales bacterium]|nr:aromatic ring-opening dioxygenase LigA [Frankiales bacterium]